MGKTFALCLLLLTPMQAAIKVEKVNHQGWPNSYRVSNGDVELVVTSDIGPRIMRYAFVGGGTNVLWEDPAGLGKSGEKEWQLRGGHRIWVGPEDIKYTYPPDNTPVKVEVQGDVVAATEPTEAITGIQKQIIIKLAPKGSGVEMVHRLWNRTNMPLEFAAWALSMMAPGGVGFTGLPPRGTHPEVLPPSNPLIIWAFTHLNDPRWIFTKKYIGLQQDAKNPLPQKIGHFNPKTWGAYFLNDVVFLKQYNPDPAKIHPDFGSSYETFTNEKFLEIETMGPLTKVPAGGYLEHIERWTLNKAARPKAWTDEELDRVLLPLLAK
jgi:hypothetical protein